MTKPTVSVVIPMYNVERFIDQSLTSVLEQTFTDFEVICVDDGSSDHTFFKVKAYQDERIRIVMQDNRGLAGARNTGINAARGKYVALLDADDFWEPTKLETHVEHLENNSHLGISFSPSWFVDEQGEALGIGQFPKLKDISAKDVFCRNPIGNGSAPVIRRSVFMEMASMVDCPTGKRMTFFNESLRQSEDVEFWLRVALTKKWQIEGVEEPLTFYRVNSSGLSANLDNQFKSWQHAVQMNSAGNETFFLTYYSLAKAYQLRYLARRAISAGNAKTAIHLAFDAVRCNAKILLEEPGRTTVTLACALLCKLPKKLYKKLEHGAMVLAGKSHFSRPLF